MLKRREKQQQMNLVIMEQMVPEDHFLRKVGRAVDFSFIYDLCAPLYCVGTGRTAMYCSGWSRLPKAVARLLSRQLSPPTSTTSPRSPKFSTKFRRGWESCRGTWACTPDTTTHGYRRHTHKTQSYGKYRFKYDPYFDAYICPEHKHLYWKTTTREGDRQYFCDSKTCKACPRRAECFGASMTRRMVERHVWQNALNNVIAFTKSEKGRRIYNWRKETIERSFAEAKVNHGLRCARMRGIRNMREQSFLTAAVQNIKRLAAPLLFYPLHC